MANAMVGEGFYHLSKVLVKQYIFFKSKIESMYKTSFCKSNHIFREFAWEDQVFFTIATWYKSPAT